MLAQSSNYRNQILTHTASLLLGSGGFLFVCLFVFLGKGKKERLTHLLQESPAPLMNAFLNICVISVRFFKQLQRRGILMRNVFIHFSGKLWMLSWYNSRWWKHHRFLRPILALLFLQIAVWYLKYSKHQVKQINNSLKTIVQQQNSVFHWKWSAVTNLS